jgi:hypothetical protein
VSSSRERNLKASAAKAPALRAAARGDQGLFRNILTRKEIPRLDSKPTAAYVASY